MLSKFKNDPKKILMGVMVTAVVLRVLVSVLFFGNEIQQLPGTFDEISYHNLAIRVIDGHGFSFGEPWWPGTGANEPTAHWSYLYTSYLIAVYTIFGKNPLVARLIQSVAVGILMPWLSYRIAYRTFNKEKNLGMFDVDGRLRRAQKIGLFVAAISAIYVYFFYYAASLISEVFYITGILWTFDVAIQIAQSDKKSVKPWLLLGLALGVTVLLRQLMLLFAPFMLLWIWWANRPKLIYLALPLMITAVFMLPWTIRNYVAFDTVVPLNTNSGHVFFWGNHPRYGTQFIPILPTGAYYAMIPDDIAAQNLNEAEMDSALLKRGFEFVAADPGRYVLLSLSRIPIYFTFWPSATSSFISNLSRVGSFGLFLPFMLYGLILSIKQRVNSWREWLASPFILFYLFILIYAAMHILTWTLVRYRVPIDAIFIIFAGWGLVDILDRVKKIERRV